MMISEGKAETMESFEKIIMKSNYGEEDFPDGLITGAVKYDYSNLINQNKHTIDMLKLSKLGAIQLNAQRMCLCRSHLEWYMLLKRADRPPHRQSILY